MREIDQLVQLMAKLPGLGPRSARRAVLQLIKKRTTLLQPLVSALQSVEASLVTCSVCGNIDTCDPCTVCTDARRDRTSLCVVEDVADLWALERIGAWRGLYHVLGGHLSALDGIGPDELAIAALEKRVCADGMSEVVLALNATLEGQTTAHYLADLLARHHVPVSALAHGVPVGGELDYIDEGTLALALRSRRPMG
jgi:recombination protein RecR